MRLILYLTFGLLLLCGCGEDKNSHTLKYQGAMLAGVKSAREKQWPESEKHFQDAVKIADESLKDSPELSQALVSLGDAKSWQKKYSEAEVDYKRALELDTSTKNGHAFLPLYHLGLNAQFQKDWNKAADYFRQAEDQVQAGSLAPTLASNLEAYYDDYEKLLVGLQRAARTPAERRELGLRHSKIRAARIKQSVNH